MANKNTFTGKAKYYNSRPTYPQACIDYLINRFALRAGSTIADIGAGTGVFGLHQFMQTAQKGPIW